MAENEVKQPCNTFGLSLHPRKQNFAGKTSLEFLGIIVDTERGVYTVSTTKLTKLRPSTMTVLRESARNGRLVSLSILRYFGSLPQSGALAVTDARLHLRSIWDGVADATARPSQRKRIRR